MHHCEHTQCTLHSKADERLYLCETNDHTQYTLHSKS